MVAIDFHHDLSAHQCARRKPGVTLPLSTLFGAMVLSLALWYVIFAVAAHVWTSLASTF